MINSRSIEDLHPALKRASIELGKRMQNAGFSMMITSTYRDFEQQNLLYEQGRSKPGVIVTYAKAGQSIHNYGLAFDICKNLKGHEYDDDNFFNVAGRLGMEMGLTWGGMFTKLLDKPHFEFTGDLGLTQLQQGKKLPLDAKIKWEFDLPTEIPTKPTTDNLNGTTKILFNGKEIEVQRILVDDTNYIKLRDLDKFGFKVSFDDVRKIPVVAKI